MGVDVDVDVDVGVGVGVGERGITWPNSLSSSHFSSYFVSPIGKDCFVLRVHPSRHIGLSLYMCK